MNKYQLYELSVQSPEQHLEMFEAMYKELRKKELRVLREDFCGTFSVSCEWVKRHPKNQAVCLDLDSEPLSYGRKNHLSKLTVEQKKRIQILRQNVLKPNPAQAEMIVANNFSFCIFKKREELKAYFRACLRSLKKGGVVLLEIAGGPGMIEKTKERKLIRPPKGAKGIRAFSYVWDQKSFDPIHRNGHYAIHFDVHGGRKYKDAFTYDWRLWTIPELREVLEEAGFERSVVYWETTHRGEGTGEYIQNEQGDNDYAWVAYVLGLK